MGASGRIALGRCCEHDLLLDRAPTASSALRLENPHHLRTEPAVLAQGLSRELTVLRRSRHGTEKGDRGGEILLALDPPRRIRAQLEKSPSHVRRLDEPLSVHCPTEVFAPLFETMSLLTPHGILTFAKRHETMVSERLSNLP